MAGKVTNLGPGGSGRPLPAPQPYQAPPPPYALPPNALPGNQGYRVVGQPTPYAQPAIPTVQGTGLPVGLERVTPVEFLKPLPLPVTIVGGGAAGGGGQGAGKGQGGGADALSQVLQGLGGNALAAAGPAGAIAGAALAAVNQLRQEARQGLRDGGEHLRALAGLDAGGVAETFEKLAAKGLPLGEELAELSKQARAAAAALDQTAKRLAPYSAELAVAQARADVAQVLGDLRRGALLGTDLARFTDARSRLSQVSQDALAKLLAPLIPVATRIVQLLADGIEGASDAWDKFLDFLVAAINKLIEQAEAIYNKLPGKDRQFPRLGRRKPGAERDLFDELTRAVLRRGLGDLPIFGPDGRPNPGRLFPRGLGQPPLPLAGGF